MEERHEPPAYQQARIRLLLVEDDPADALRFREILSNAGETAFDISQTSTLEKALLILQQEDFDVVLLDLTLPEAAGLDTLARARVAASTVPMIAMTTEDDQAQAVSAMRLGAQDYLVKGQSDPRLIIRCLLQAVERHRLFVELRAAERREHHLATHDTLTGLPNRYFFQLSVRRSLQYAERNGKRAAVLLLDLDRFKYINDTLGHSAGDELLVEVARRLKDGLRKSDIVARLGGDEFVVMIQDVNRDYDPAKVAGHLVEELALPYVLEGRECWITTSVGIAVYPDNGTDPDALNRCADTAMYAAKAAGKNRYHFYTRAMNEAAQRRFTLENKLRDALKQSSFEIHYQPRVDTATNTILGAEALLRLNDPELGNVSPTEFIPIAEETGLIVPIGEWVLHEACAQTKAWQLTGFPSLRVSVNFSAVQLLDEGLRDSTVRVLWETGLDASCLEFELTESALVRERSANQDILKELKRIGIAISLDDFGTGYSSLSYLKRMPVDTVKIDRAFVREMLVDGDDAAIVVAIISIADKLRLGVVAEGVETAAQREFLRRNGCDEMQGYLFSPPLPPDDFLDLLRRGRSGP